MFHYVFVATTSQRRYKITRGAHLFPPHLPLPIYLLVTRSEQFYSTGEILVVTVRCHLVICQRPREKRTSGGRDREARWIKNEDKSVLGIAGGVAADGNAGKFGRSARSFAGTIDHFAGTHDPQDNPGP